MEIALTTDHEKALAEYLAAGHSFPAIPAGCNTVYHHFETVEGQNAVIINQRGFTPTAADDEQSVNGCSLVIALDPPDAAIARATLETWVREFLELQ